MNRPWTYKCVLPLEPFFCLPLHLSCHRTLGLSSLHHTASFHWLSFTYGKAYVSVILSQFIPLSPSSTVSTSLFFMSASPFSSVQSFSHVWLFQPYGLQNDRLPCPSPTPGACSSSSPWSRWYHQTISSFVTPFFSCLQSFPASGFFLMSQFFASDAWSIGASASASVLPMNIQDWFPLGLTGLISLQSKGLLRVFSNTTVQKHHFFNAQLSLWSNSHIHTWLLEKP